jgi:ABC-type multidrug transport system ATPase subunit
MLEATAGHITINGIDIRTNIQDVRKILGFCPQYGQQNKPIEVEARIIAVYVCCRYSLR